MPEPPEKTPARADLDVGETAKSLSDAVDDPTLKALLRTRPFVAVILLSHQGDHVEATTTGVSVTYGSPGEGGTIHIAPDVLATLRNVEHPPQPD